MMVLSLFVLVYSCGQDGDSSDDVENLVSYCIRECVLETGASEICDTRCKCATQKLSSGLSKAEFRDLARNITQDQADDRAIRMFKDALNNCKYASN